MQKEITKKQVALIHIVTWVVIISVLIVINYVFYNAMNNAKDLLVVLTIISSAISFCITLMWFESYDRIIKKLKR